MGCRVVAPDMQLKRTACNASQPWIDADTSAALEFDYASNNVGVDGFAFRRMREAEISACADRRFLNSGNAAVNRVSAGTENTVKSEV